MTLWNLNYCGKKNQNIFNIHGVLYQKGYGVMNQDLTVGKPETVLWKFCLPLFGSIIFQQLYNIVDSLVAGKCVGGCWEQL